jgi:serine/threonine-protein kinase
VCGQAVSASGDLSPEQLRIAQQLFEREAEVLEELGSNHPQFQSVCVPLLKHSNLQLGKEDKFFYLVQEFIDGQDLEAELKTKGTLYRSGSSGGATGNPEGAEVCS